MGRPKGSKNKKTLNQSGQQSTIKEHIQHLRVKCGRPTIPKHVLRLTNWLYITCDSHCWKIVEVVDTINPKTGEKYPDKSLFYAGELHEILKIAIKYLTRVPGDVQELSDKINEIYNLIDSHIPKKINPRDLFEELNIDDSVD